MKQRERESRAGSEDRPVLSMTPMIDVVFLLLVFFVFAIKPVDALARLEAQRPKAGGVADTLELVAIGIDTMGVTFNQRRVTLGQLDRTLGQLAEYSRTTTVTLRCDLASRHGAMVEVMDLCSKHGLGNIAVFSR